MADISKIKLPNNVTYNVKDANALPLTGGTMAGDITIPSNYKLNVSSIKASNGSSSLVSYDSTTGNITFGNAADNNTIIKGGSALYFNNGLSDYKIWHENNDGSGSGLDADLLDGQNGSYYDNRIFIAQYGTTTYDEITAAWSAGKMIIVDGTNIDGDSYIFIPDYKGNQTEPPTYFSCLAGDESRIIWCYIDSSDDSWSNGQYYIQHQLTSGTDIKTINNTSLLGSGNISINPSPWFAGPNSDSTAILSPNTNMVYAEDCADVSFGVTGSDSDGSGFLNDNYIIGASAGGASFAHGAIWFEDSADVEVLYEDGGDALINADNSAAHAEGCVYIDSYAANNVASGKIIASGRGSHAEGYAWCGIDDNDHEILRNEIIASGDGSHAEGRDTKAVGISSHAEGESSKSIGVCSHSEGGYSFSQGNFSHSEGSQTLSYGQSSHSEGSHTTSYGHSSHSEGYGDCDRNTSYTVSGSRNATTYTTSAAHDLKVGDLVSLNVVFVQDDDISEKVVKRITEIPSTTSFKVNSTFGKAISNVYLYKISGVSFGASSHSEGYKTAAKGNYSHSEGGYTETTNTYEHASGFCNKSNTISSNTFGNAGRTLSSIGIGTSRSARKNAFEVMENGDVYIYGIGNYDGTNPNTTGVNDIKTTINEKESTSNKVTSISSSSTNDEYSSAKCVYDNINPIVQTSQPAGGMLPNVLYNLGTISSSTSFSLSTPLDSNVCNHYYWMFDTGSSAPTITWPSSITAWNGGSAPTINSSKHYEISVLNGVGAFMEV